MNWSWRSDNLATIPLKKVHKSKFKSSSYERMNLSDDNDNKRRACDSTTSKFMTKILTLFAAGCILGLLMPKNQDLPTKWYRTVSSMIGYTYFLSWSVSFYPQIWMNYKRQSTLGLSNDFSVLNVVGFACYSLYTSMFFWSPTVQSQYKQRHTDVDAEITVQSNDVAFAFHALILSTFQLCQIVYYNDFRYCCSGFRLFGYSSRWGQSMPSDEIESMSSPLNSSTESNQTQRETDYNFHLSSYTIYFLRAIFILCLVYAILTYYSIHDLIWPLDYLYMLSFVKLTITTVKYIPQVLLNVNRQSTVGWNIWNIILDLTGGLLSLLQLVFDSVDLNDFGGITGNWVKFGLSFVSIIFDVIFLLQHYVWYAQDSH